MRYFLGTLANMMVTARESDSAERFYPLHNNLLRGLPHKCAACLARGGSPEFKCTLKEEGFPYHSFECDLSAHPATFLTVHAQLVEDPWTSYSFVLCSMESIFAAVLAPFPLVEVKPDHRRSSAVLEVEGRAGSEAKK